MVGRTETLSNNLNPEFSREIIAPFKFEEEQLAVIRIFDDDYGKKSDDFLGETAPFKIGTLMGSKGQTLKLAMELNGRVLPKSSITVHAEDTGDGAEATLHLSLIGRNFDRKDGFFGKSDPFFTLYSSVDGIAWELAYRSEYVKQNLNPKWAPAVIPFRKLENKKLKLDVTDYDNDGSHDLIGIAYPSLNDLLGKTKNIEVVHPPTKDKYKKSSYKNSGYVDVIDARLDRPYTMIAYLKGGLQVSMMVAIDFTGSNGDPRDPQSLHYGSGRILNSYIEAIHAIGNIVMEYDYDKLIPAYGFGARPIVGASVSHCFPLSGNAVHEQVSGIEGVLAAYTSCFDRGVVLSGPTYFAQIIRRCAALANGSPNAYSVLLLITDGAVNDMQETINAICDAAMTPLSIIIVGVGNADFSNMEFLDGDSKALKSSSGVPCRRDIVQFVPYNRIKAQGGPGLLAKETLKELPGQLVGYYTAMGIPPAPPVVVGEPEIMTAAPNPPSAPPAGAQSSQQQIGQIGKTLFAQAVSF